MNKELVEQLEQTKQQFKVGDEVIATYMGIVHSGVIDYTFEDNGRTVYCVVDRMGCEKYYYEEQIRTLIEG